MYNETTSRGGSKLGGDKMRLFVRGTGVRPFCWIIALPFCAGCLPQLPENVKLPDPPLRSILREVPDGMIETEAGISDSVWLEVNRPGGGTIGGYLSLDDSPKKSLVLLLHG